MEVIVIFFHERNERYQMQRKLLGVPSTFGRHCRNVLREVILTSDQLDEARNT